jgi:hypothetical protein
VRRHICSKISEGDTFGRGFLLAKPVAAPNLKTLEPISLDGVEKYLGSGVICGIGPAYTEKLVRNRRKFA